MLRRRTPRTAELSRAQVIDAAHEIVASLKLRVVEAFFWHASCNDQGESPFRGQMRIAYLPAATFADSDAQIVQQLRDAGWSVDPGFHSHGTALTKNNVVVVFGPQNVSDPNREVELFGECRDVASTNDHQRTRGAGCPGVTLAWFHEHSGARGRRPRLARGSA